MDEDQAARAGAQSSATYEQQMELLQRQLFRLSAEKQARLSKQQQQEHQQEPGQASNVTVVRAPQADDRSSESEPDTDDEEAWDEAEEGGADAAAADEASTAVRQKGVLVHFQNRQVIEFCRHVITLLHLSISHLSPLFPHSETASGCLSFAISYPREVCLWLASLQLKHKRTAADKLSFLACSSSPPQGSA